MSRRNINRLAAEDYLLSLHDAQLSAQDVLRICRQLEDRKVSLDAAADAEDQQQENGHVVVDQNAPETNCQGRYESIR